MTWNDLARYNHKVGGEMMVMGNEVSISKEDDSVLTLDKLIRKADKFIAYSSSIVSGIWNEAQNRAIVGGRKWM
jgi:hypothetical protein